MDTQAAEMLIGREADLRRLETFVGALRHAAPAAGAIVNLVGLLGIGKTALLHRMHAFCIQQHDLIVLSLDFADLPPQAALADAQRMALSRLQAAAPPTHQLLQQTLALLAAPEPDAHAVAVARAAAGQPDAAEPAVVLLLDACERLPDGFLAWLERCFLSLLVPHNRMLAFCAGRSPLRWLNYDVRERVHLHVVGPLDPAETQTQIGPPTQLGALVYRISCGHPLANKVIAAWLHANGRDPQVAAQHEAELAELVVTALRARMPAAPPIDFTVLCIVALFREYDAVALQAVLPHVVTEYRDATQLQYLQLTRQLAATGLISLNRVARAYSLNVTLRGILRRFLIVNAPEQYAAAHESIIGFYEQLLETTPSHRPTALVEYCYQLLARTEPTRAWYLAVLDHMRLLLARYYAAPHAAHAEQLRQLAERFAADTDISALLTTQELAADAVITLIAAHQP